MLLFLLNIKFGFDSCVTVEQKSGNERGNLIGESRKVP